MDIYKMIKFPIGKGKHSETKHNVSMSQKKRVCLKNSKSNLFGFNPNYFFLICFWLTMERKNIIQPPPAAFSSVSITFYISLSLYGLFLPLSNNNISSCMDANKLPSHSLEWSRHTEREPDLVTGSKS